MWQQCCQACVKFCSDLITKDQITEKKFHWIWMEKASAKSATGSKLVWRTLLIEAEWRIYASQNYPLLDQMMACHLVGARLLSKPMLKYCQSDKLQWNFNQNSYIFIQENPSKDVVWKKAAILSWPQCAKIWMLIGCYVKIILADN